MCRKVCMTIWQCSIAYWRSAVETWALTKRFFEVRETINNRLVICDKVCRHVSRSESARKLFLSIALISQQLCRAKPPSGRRVKLAAGRWTENRLQMPATNGPVAAIPIMQIAAFSSIRLRGPSRVGSSALMVFVPFVRRLIKARNNKMTGVTSIQFINSPSRCKADSQSAGRKFRHLKYPKVGLYSFFDILEDVNA